MMKQSADSKMMSYDTPDYEGFHKLLKESAESFLQIPKNKTIRVVGHLDADGICASAIIINACINMLFQRPKSETLILVLF